MNTTPRGERMNICFLGRTNVGKSSLINSLLGQNISIISDLPGTTTDPVLKRFELHPIGAVTFFDTAGYDDYTELGEKRMIATMKVLYKSDLAVLVIDHKGLLDSDKLFIEKLKELNVPFFIISNKSDLALINEDTKIYLNNKNIDYVSVNALNIDEQIIFSNIISKLQSLHKDENSILKDLIKENDQIVLVMPIDSAAPKGRIILPQVQVIREILDLNAVAICCTGNDILTTINNLCHPPRMVITDSQIINNIYNIIPEDIPLTTFSVLFARYRGELNAFINGLCVLKELKETDHILIAEACSHHKTGEDIGTVKIPRWLSEYLGFMPNITKISGSDFPDDLDKYKLVIHCGGCMLTKIEMIRRINECQRQNVAITNYGIIISEINGVLSRTIKELI